MYPFGLVSPFQSSTHFRKYCPVPHHGFLAGWRSHAPASFPALRSACAVFFSRWRSTGASISGLGHEGILGTRLEHHICTPPRLIVDQAPFMAFADMVHSDQHIARSEYERLPVGGSEFKRPRQRDHELRFRIRMPIIRGMCRRFLEMDGNHVSAIFFVDSAFKHMRCVIGSGVELERSQHVSASSYHSQRFALARSIRSSPRPPITALSM